MLQVAPAAYASTSTAPGRAELAAIRSGSRTVVSRAFATSPLRLLTPRNHGRAAWIYTSSFGGGLVDGDRTHTEIDVGSGAAVLLSTQASTKVYRSPRGTAAGLQARVADDGLLVMAPDPVVCFAGARYRQTSQIDLHRSATLVLIDWMSSGRHHSGERWAFDEYTSRLTVRRDQRLLVYDALALRRSDGGLADRLGRFNVLAIAVLAGPALASFMDAVMARANGPIRQTPDLLVAAAPAAADHTWVIRVAGLSIEPVGRSLRELLDFVPGLLGDDPWARKW